MERLEHSFEAENNSIVALVIEPNKAPEKVIIENELETLQEIVGGHIEAIYPFDDPVALIMDEEGKLKRKELNRSLCNENGIYDIIAGKFLVVGLGEEDFASLTPSLLEKYEKKFEFPEIFMLNKNAIYEN